MRALSIRTHRRSVHTHSNPSHIWFVFGFCCRRRREQHPLSLGIQWIIVWMVYLHWELDGVYVYITMRWTAIICAAVCNFHLNWTIVVIIFTYLYMVTDSTVPLHFSSAARPAPAWKPIPSYRLICTCLLFACRTRFDVPMEHLGPNEKIASQCMAIMADEMKIIILFSMRSAALACSSHSAIVYAFGGTFGGSTRSIFKIHKNGNDKTIGSVQLPAHSAPTHAEQTNKLTEKNARNWILFVRGTFYGAFAALDCEIWWVCRQ